MGIKEIRDKYGSLLGRIKYQLWDWKSYFKLYFKELYNDYKGLIGTLVKPYSLLMILTMLGIVLLFRGFTGILLLALLAIVYFHWKNKSSGRHRGLRRGKHVD